MSHKHINYDKKNQSNEVIINNKIWKRNKNRKNFY